MKAELSRYMYLTGPFIMMSTNVISGNQSAETGRPNILIIMADDATHKDLPLYGGENVQTPNIDKLARQGLTFNRAYVSMSMSVPCRASLYTGLYPVNNGVCWNHVPARNNTESIVQRLGELGYRVGLAGKVHASPEKVFPFEMVEGLERDCVAPTAGFELTELRKFILRKDNQPFCLIAALVVPHIPWTVGVPSHFNPDKLKLPPYLADTQPMREQFAKYLAEIEVLDQQVGSLLAMVDETGKTGNTIVIFTSEQGAQLPGCKWTNWDMGVHTGFVVKWTGKIQAGEQTNAIIQYEDVLPTLLEAAGGHYKPESFDGTSFLQVLLGKKNVHREYAYFMHNNIPEGPSYPIRSITDGTYHYIRNLKPENIYIEKHLMARMPENNYWPSWIFQSQTNDNTYNLVTRYMIRPAEQLYCVDSDPFELTNIANDKSFSDIKNKLSLLLDQWMKRQGDPGAEIDNREQWENAVKGNHFSKVSK